jgi:hypothetical protein
MPSPIWAKPSLKYIGSVIPAAIKVMGEAGHQAHSQAKAGATNKSGTNYN